jgi:hypothetical protein
MLISLVSREVRNQRSKKSKSSSTLKTPGPKLAHDQFRKSLVPVSQLKVIINIAVKRW